jgi:hypothetical protein
MTGITENIRRNFSFKTYNLIVGGIFTFTSLVGWFLVYAHGILHAWPRWLILVAYLALVIVAIAVAKRYRDDANVQVVTYGIAVAPMAMFFAAFLRNLFPNKTWDVYTAAEKATAISNNPELANDPRLNATFNFGDIVLVAAFICTIAFVIMTICSVVLEKWMLQRDTDVPVIPFTSAIRWLSKNKTAIIMAVVSYVLALVIATTIFGMRIINVWTVVFSAIPFLYAVSIWSYQTGGPITPERAYSTPMCTFLACVDAAEAVNA